MSGALLFQKIVQNRLVPHMFMPCYNDGTPPRANGVTPLTTDREDTPTMADESVPQRVSVYKATCAANGKQYVGITVKSVAARWRVHVSDAAWRVKKSALARAILAHGAAQFTVEEICVAFGRENACLIERDMIAEYGTMAPFGYNLSSGGEGMGRRVLSEESRARVSESLLKRWADPEFRARMIEAFQNRTTPPSHIAHLRELAAKIKGRPRSADAAAKTSAALMGHSVSAETRAKMSAARKGKGLWTGEQKRRHGDSVRAAFAAGERPMHGERMREAALKRWADPKFRAEFKHGMKGRKHSEEAKLKMSQTRRERAAKRANVQDSRIVLEKI